MPLASIAWRAASIALQSPATGTGSIAGAWTLNADLSDKSADRGDRGERGDGDARGRGNGGYGRRGGMARDGERGNPEDTARMRDAMRDLMNPSEHLTITQTDSMVVMTAAD